MRRFKAALVAALLAGCSSPRTVDHDYHDELKSKSILRASSTTIVFLIDGFSTALLSDALARGTAKNLETFFKESIGHPPDASASYLVGRASFPTLTFPNLTSILTGEIVATHGILGNHVRENDGTVTDFEDVRSWDALNHRVHTMTVFAQLSAFKEPAVNYSYPFSEARGTTVDQNENLSAALSYLSRDYAAVDHETLESLRILLTKTKAEQWPRFIFVHAIGVDALEHEFGPGHAKVKQYVQDLDRRLAPAFDAIRKVESEGHSVTTLLTADHGFASIEHEVPLQEEIRKIDTAIFAVSDNRTAPIYLPEDWPIEKRHETANRLRAIEHVGWVFEKEGSTVFIYGPSGPLGRVDLTPGHCEYLNWQARFQWTATGVSVRPAGAVNSSYCMETFDRGTFLNRANISYIVPALVEYFAGQAPPAMILVADDTSEFSGKYRGNHGGLTTDEILVPILTRNAEFPAGQVVPTSQLLRYLKLF